MSFIRNWTCYGQSCDLYLEKMNIFIQISKFIKFMVLVKYFVQFCNSIVFCLYYNYKFSTNYTIRFVLNVHNFLRTFAVSAQVFNIFREQFKELQNIFYIFIYCKIKLACKFRFLVYFSSLVFFSLFFLVRMVFYLHRNSESIFLSFSWNNFKFETT